MSSNKKKRQQNNNSESYSDSVISDSEEENPQIKKNPNYINLPHKSKYRMRAHLIPYIQLIYIILILLNALIGLCIFQLN